MGKVKYKVELTKEERQELKRVIVAKKNEGQVKRAQILLKLDKNGPTPWSYVKMHDVFGVSEDFIRKIAKRFVAEGVEGALCTDTNYPRKATKDVREKIYAIANSSPPEGQSHWTLKAIVEELQRTGIIDTISIVTVHRVLKDQFNH